MTGTRNSLLLRRRFGMLADQAADERDGQKAPRKKSEQGARPAGSDPLLMMLWWVFAFAP